jgi:hypothetical protein
MYPIYKQKNEEFQDLRKLGQQIANPQIAKNIGSANPQIAPHAVGPQM